MTYQLHVEPCMLQVILNSAMLNQYFTEVDPGVSSEMTRGNHPQVIIDDIV